MTFNNLKLKIKNYSKGFTLVELLIVIAIIGVLSALLMANFIGVRQRARDAQRKANLRQIQSALEFYRSDNDGYPIYAGGTIDDTQNSPLVKCSGGFGNSACTSIYMQKVPTDPLGVNNQHYYYSSTDGNTYTLRACLENSADKDSDQLTTLCDPSKPKTHTDFRLSNP